MRGGASSEVRKLQSRTRCSNEISATSAFPFGQYFIAASCSENRKTHNIAHFRTDDTICIPNSLREAAPQNVSSQAKTPDFHPVYWASMQKKGKRASTPQACQAQTARQHEPPAHVRLPAQRATRSASLAQSTSSSSSQVCTFAAEEWHVKEKMKTGTRSDFGV